MSWDIMQWDTVLFMIKWVLCRLSFLWDVLDLASVQQWNFVPARHTQTHRAVLRPFVQDNLGGPVPEDTFTHSHLKHVMGVCHHSGLYKAWGRLLIEASAPTIRLDATPSGPSMPPPLSSPNFMPDSLPVATFPIYPGLVKLDSDWNYYSY